MAKKFDSFLLWTALACAAIAGGIVYFSKRKNKNKTCCSHSEEFTDDFAEISEEHSTQTAREREYVTIPKDAQTTEANKESNETEGNLQNKKH